MPHNFTSLNVVINRRAVCVNGMQDSTRIQKKANAGLETRLVKRHIQRKESTMLDDKIDEKDQNMFTPYRPNPRG
jgi:hypothetical protein